MEHRASIFIFHPNAAYHLSFQMPARVDEGLLERNPTCWKGTLKYIETQIAAHRAQQCASGG